MNARTVNNTTGKCGSERAGRGPVAFVITFKVKPDRREEFQALLGDVLDAIRHEPTFINAILHRDAQDPAKVMLYETWADFDDVVNVQIGRPYRKIYWDRLPDLLEEPQQIETWYPTRGDFVRGAGWQPAVSVGTEGL